MHGEELRQRRQNQPPPTPARSAQHAAPRAHNLATGAWGRTHQVQRNIMDGGNDPPQFARAGQNIAAVTMLLHGLPEPNDPQEQAIHRNLRALVETTTVQQAESSASRHRLAASLPTRGMGTHQTNCSIRSPLQSPGAEQVAAAAPWPNPARAPHRPLVREWLRLNQDARIFIYNRRQARHDDDVHRGR